MATYVLPDDRLTEEQRNRYLDTTVPDDLFEIARHLRDHFPAVFDDAVQHTGRPYVLAALHSKQETSR